MQNNVQILGKNNYVDPSAKNVFIVGDGNKVLGNVFNVTIVGNDITVDESDTVFIDGVQRSNNSKGRGEDTVTKTASFNVDIQVKQYLIDTTAGDVNVDMEGIFLGGEMYPNYVVYFKKLVQANKITFTTSNNISIDGETSAKIKNKNTNVRLWYDGFGNAYTT